MSQISVTAHTQNVEVKFNMHKNDLKVLRIILNLAESKLHDLAESHKNGLAKMNEEAVTGVDDLINMIRGAILTY